MSWNYSDKVKEHYLHPHNVGEIEDAEAVGEVGSMVCGDALKLYLKIDKEKEIILDAKFQTYGCGSAIASSSALTDLIKGKTINEALKVSNKDLADYLDGLPEEKMHCSVMGKDALEVAIGNYLGKPVHHEEEDANDRLVCHCFNVTEQQIKRVVIENNLKTIEEVTNYTKAGGACGSCLGEIDEILREVLNEQAEKAAKEEPKPVKKVSGKLSPYKKFKLIEETLDSEIRPALQLDSGGLELVDIDEDKVYVKLLGQCHGCGFSNTTIDFIQTRLEDVLGEHIEVQNIE